MSTTDSKPPSLILPAVPAARISEKYSTNSIGTRLSEAELSEVEAAAASAGKKVGEWLRDAALAQARAVPARNTDLMSYLDSTERGKQPGATTQVQWLFKTAPGRKRILVINSDVVSANSADPPVQLSEFAIQNGWTGIEKGAPVQTDSAGPEQLLQQYIYNGHGFWGLMAEPVILASYSSWL